MDTRNRPTEVGPFLFTPGLFTDHLGSRDGGGPGRGKGVVDGSYSPGFAMASSTLGWPVLLGAAPRADHSRRGRGHGELRAARPPGSARAPAAPPLAGTHDGRVAGWFIAEDARMRVAAHRTDRLRRRGDERRILLRRRNDLPIAGVRRGTAADIAVQIEIRPGRRPPPIPRDEGKPRYKLAHRHLGTFWFMTARVPASPHDTP